MTKRLPVSSPQNSWTDGECVTKDDLDTEQNSNNSNDEAIVNNFFGSGVLLESLDNNIIFDTNELTPLQAGLVAAGTFDGNGLEPASQPTDNLLGNQLKVTLSDSTVFGRFSVKVLIIGLNFDGDLIMDRMNFYRNGEKVTANHYARVLTIMFNDLKGNNNCSANYGGRVLIEQAAPMYLSKDPKSVAQDFQPDIFFRDFRVADKSKGLYNTIQEAIGPNYNADDLNINITGLANRTLPAGSTTKRIGQKFQATTNNIQKITLLAGVYKNENADLDTLYDWSGDLIISFHRLQTKVACITDIVPDLDIEFDPDPNPLVELSFSQAELRAAGYTLTDVAQPVDFVFNDSMIGVPGGISPDEYYVVTARRSGSTVQGEIFFEVGADRLDQARLTIFNNGVWADVPEEDMWFQVWSDAGKITDGQAYDCGKGVFYPKTTTDPTTGQEIDNQERYFNFITNAYSVKNTGVVKAVSELNSPAQDQITGNTVFERKQNVPEFDFVTNSDLETLKETSDPLIIGCAEDNNPQNNPEIMGEQTLPGTAKGDVFTIVDPQPDILSQQLIGSVLIPNNDCAAKDYRIFKVDVCVDGYGDVNGDGVINDEDLFRMSQLIGESVFFPSTQQKIVDGYISLLELLRADVDNDGYVSANDFSLLQSYLNREINSFPAGTSFTHVDLTVQASVGRYDGYFDCGPNYLIDGYCTVVFPDDLTVEEREYYGNHAPPPSIDGEDVVFRTVPFEPVEYKILPQQFWVEYLINVNSKAKILPATFAREQSNDSPDCGDTTPFGCEDSIDRQQIECDPGQNDFYIPGNLILGEGSQILNEDGSNYKHDFEIYSIILQIPEEPLNEVNIDIFTKFLLDRGDKLTASGYAAPRYSDCTTVQPEDLALNRLRFDIAVQALNKNLDGYEPVDGYGIIVDDTIGVFMDHDKGILRLTMANMEVDSIFKSLITKIQITVYMKKAGWNNKPLVVTPDELAGFMTMGC